MKRILTYILSTVISFSAAAQGVDDVTLVVNGMGATKGEATNLALRSAIEQAFGVFVSANTSIVNDELVKDEIATVASGNIKSYKELESVILPNNTCLVTLQAVVSTQKLVAYAKSKGSSCEFAGATLMANRKLMLLNKANTEKVFDNLMLQLEEIAPFIFDHQLKLGEPMLNSDQRNFTFPVRLEITSNENTEGFVDLLYSTLKAVALSEVDKINAEKLLGEKMNSLEVKKEYISTVSAEYNRQSKDKLYFYSPFDVDRLEDIIKTAMNNIVVENNLGIQYNVPDKFWKTSRIGVKWQKYDGPEDEVVAVVVVPDFYKPQPLFKTKKNSAPQPHSPIIISTSHNSHLSVPFNMVNQLTKFEVLQKQCLELSSKITKSLRDDGILYTMMNEAQGLYHKSASRFVNYENHPYIVILTEKEAGLVASVSEKTPIQLLLEVVNIGTNEEITHPAKKIGEIVRKLLVTPDLMDVKRAKEWQKTGDLRREGYEYITEGGYEYVAYDDRGRYSIISSLLDRVTLRATNYSGWKLYVIDVNDILYYDYAESVRNITSEQSLQYILDNPEKDQSMPFRTMKQEWIIVKRSQW